MPKLSHCPFKIRRRIIQFKCNTSYFILKNIIGNYKAQRKEEKNIEKQILRITIAFTNNLSAFYKELNMDITFGPT